MKLNWTQDKIDYLQQHRFDLHDRVLCHKLGVGRTSLKKKIAELGLYKRESAK